MKSILYRVFCAALEDLYQLTPFFLTTILDYVRQQSQILLFSPRSLFNLRVQKASIVLSALLGMPVNFICFWVECVELFRDVFPFVSGLSVLPT